MHRDLQQPWEAPKGALAATYCPTILWTMTMNYRCFLLLYM